MKLGSKGTFLGAAAIAVLCLLGAAAHAQTAPDKVPMTDEVFKSVMLLKGIPVDTFFEAMGMFANSMGNDCTFCHSQAAVFDKAKFAEQTPRILKARQMIVMMNAINKQYFGGQTRVTCFTCHNGSDRPRSEPDLALQYAEPVFDPNAREIVAADPRVTANQVFDKYIQVLGGADRLAKLTSYVAKGTYAGFDTDFSEIPVEIYAAAPNRMTVVTHLSTGINTKAYNGSSGWIAGPDTPLPLVTLTAGNLDRARLEAIVAFPAAIRQAFSEWRVGIAVIGDQGLQVVQGLRDGQPAANLYFDDSGLLVRLVTWTRTPVALVPTQIDYADYRDVAGVKVPFKRTVSQTYMRMVIEVTDVQPNVAIDRKLFERPAPVAPAA
jgi:photosynthetic reaction center cytochrome c subunit